MYAKRSTATCTEFGSRLTATQSAILLYDLTLVSLHDIFLSRVLQPRQNLACD